MPVIKVQSGRLFHATDHNVAIRYINSHSSLGEREKKKKERKQEELRKTIVAENEGRRISEMRQERHYQKE